MDLDIDTDLLKYYRNRKKITQEEMAWQVKTGQGHYCRMENKRKIITLDMLRRIFAVLDLTTAEKIKVLRLED